MRVLAVRYSFYVDDGVTGEIGAETAPSDQRLTDEQRALLERIQQLVAQAQAALTSQGADAMMSGVKLVNAVNALRGSLAKFQTAMRTGDASSQKSTAQSVVSAATEFQKTLEGIKTANPDVAIPASLKSLSAGLAGLKDMMSQKAQVGKITRTAILRGGVTDLAAARILSAIKAIVSDKTQPQTVRDALAAVSKALDARKTAGPLTVKDIVQALAGKGQDSVNAVVAALAAAKQPAAAQAVVAALASIPEKGTQMAALATVAVAQVSQQIAAQVITHIATVNPQAAAQIMTTIAAAQPAVIQSVVQTAIQSEKPSIVAMALAALTEVKQQQSGRADLGQGELRQTQPSGGGVSLADVKAAGAAMVAEILSRQKPATPNGKVVPTTTGTGPINFEAPKETPSNPVGGTPRPTVNDSIVTQPPPSNPENKINPAPPQNPPSPPPEGPPTPRADPQPVTPNPSQEGLKPDPMAPTSPNEGQPPPQPATPPPAAGPTETPANPSSPQTLPVTPTPERIPDPSITGPDSRPTVYVAEGPPVVINGEPYQTMTRTVWCPDCGPNGGPVVEVVTAAEQHAMKGAAADGIDPKLAALYDQQKTKEQFDQVKDEIVCERGHKNCGGHGNEKDRGSENGHHSDEGHKQASPVNRVEISTPGPTSSEPGEIQFSVNRFNANSDAKNNAGRSTRQRRQANIKAPAPNHG